MSLTLDNFVRSNHLSMKYETVTLSGCKDIGIGKSEFVAKTQILLEFNRSRICQHLGCLFFKRKMDYCTFVNKVQVGPGTKVLIC